MQVAISTQGAATGCKIVKTSGSVRLDTTACTFVQEHWRWKPPTRDGQPITAIENVSVIWNLEGAP
jgi:TonB family protein